MFLLSFALPPSLRLCLSVSLSPSPATSLSDRWSVSWGCGPGALEERRPEKSRERLLSALSEDWVCLSLGFSVAGSKDFLLWGNQFSIESGQGTCSRGKRVKTVGVSSDLNP